MTPKQIMTPNEVKVASALAIETKEHSGHCTCKSCGRLVHLLIRYNASVDRDGTISYHERQGSE
jgi:hypothetical protein